MSDNGWRAEVTMKRVLTSLFVLTAIATPAFAQQGASQQQQQPPAASARSSAEIAGRFRLDVAGANQGAVQNVEQGGADRDAPPPTFNPLAQGQASEAVANNRLPTPTTQPPSTKPRM